MFPLIAVVLLSVAVAHGTQFDCTDEAGKLSRPVFITVPVPFSDDLLPAVLGKDVTRDWALRGPERPSPQEMAKTYAAAIQKSETAFATELRRTLAGKRFVDLGCGPPQVSAVPRIVAEALGAKEYIGVDQRNRDQVRRGEFTRGGAFTSTFVKQDLLAYLANEAKTGNNVFHLSGIEARDGKAKEAAEYAASIKRRLATLCNAGDAVVVGAACPNFDSIPGFVLKAWDGEQRIFVRSE